MPQHLFKKETDLKLEQKAFMLYKQGLTTRQVGKTIGRSHQWVALRIKKLFTDGAIDRVLQKSKMKVRKS